MLLLSCATACCALGQTATHVLNFTGTILTENGPYWTQYFQPGDPFRLEVQIDTTHPVNINPYLGASQPGLNWHFTAGTLDLTVPVGVDASGFGGNHDYPAWLTLLNNVGFSIGNDTVDHWAVRVDAYGWNLFDGPLTGWDPVTGSSYQNLDSSTSWLSWSIRVFDANNQYVGIDSLYAHLTSVSVTAVPEPASYALVGAAAAALATIVVRRRRFAR